jgi:uncharacterized membrane protein
MSGWVYDDLDEEEWIALRRVRFLPSLCSGMMAVTFWFVSFMTGMMSVVAMAFMMSFCCMVSVVRCRAC